MPLAEGVRAAPGYVRYFEDDSAKSFANRTVAARFAFALGLVGPSACLVLTGPWATPSMNAVWWSPLPGLFFLMSVAALPFAVAGTICSKAHKGVWALAILVHFVSLMVIAFSGNGV